jgi:hypothetical protein
MDVLTPARSGMETIVQQDSDRHNAHPPVYAEMNYLGEQADRPVWHTTDRTQSRMSLEPHRVAIHDARPIRETSLDREGFQLVQQRLPELDYLDVAQRDGPYLVLLQELIRTTLGASKVISDTSVLRLPGKNAFQKPLLTVHSDYTPASARRLLQESWDQEKGKDQGLAETASIIQSLESPREERRYSRVIALNAWRPITQPPHDYPLAVCSRESLASTDIRPADFIEDQYKSELTLCAYNENHKWYCYSDMTPDEVLFFFGFDFADAPCGAMHSAFRDPGCPADVLGRSSIEVRAFAFFE